MAKTPITRAVSTTNPYTVPSGKTFVGDIFPRASGGYGTIRVTTSGGSMDIYELVNEEPYRTTLKPIVLVAGAQVSIAGGSGGCLLCGFEYDN